MLDKFKKLMVLVDDDVQGLSERLWRPSAPRSFLRTFIVANHHKTLAPF